MKQYRLTDGSEWTAQQIADLTGASVSTVRNRLSKSREPYRVLARRGLRDRGFT